MADFEAQYSKFRLDDNLTKNFSNFETEWSLENKVKIPYSIVTIMNNDTMRIENLAKEQNNA